MSGLVDEAPFRLDVQKRDGVVTLALGGELDLTTAPTLIEAAEGIEGAGTSRVLVDLRDLSFMDSAGVGVLMNLDLRARETGFTLAIVRGPGAVARLLELCGIPERILTVDDPAELD